MDMDDETALRVVALQAATEGASLGCRQDDVLDRAQAYFDWLTRRTPATISLTVGEVEKQPQQEEQNPMQIHDDEQFSVTLEVKDAKGFDIQGDQITVTVDNTDVVSAEAQADGSYNIVAGNPGSAVVTFNAGTDDNGNPVVVTEAVDVVPGNVATVQITEGTPTKQAAAAPASAGDTTGTTAPAGTDAGTPAPADTTTDAGTTAPADTTTPEGGAGAPAV